MALNQQEEKASNKVRVIVITILASIIVGALLALVIFQTGLGNTLYINSLRISTADPELNEPIKNIQEVKQPSKFSLDEIESWHSWMQTNGLYHKIAKKQLDGHKDRKLSSIKNILLWNDRNDDSSLATEDYWDGTLLPLEVAGCPISQCQLVNRLRPSPGTSNDLKLSEYDAIVFRYNDLNVKDLPERRWPTQKYIFYELDSPIISRVDAGLADMIPPNFFNLTMTHRWDSDIVVPLGGWIEPVASKIIDDHQIAENSKSKMIAWMVDGAKDCRLMHSRNRRQKELIEHLKKYNIQVDIIRQSDCAILESTNDCGSELQITSKSDYISHLQCHQKVAKEYAFYFAMEEDLCLDYITEKFYSMLDQPIIPLVMDTHGNYAKAAPPHSYINALDFPSVRSLANYLIGLNENNHLYNEYFLWKKYFKVLRHDKKGGDMNHLCNLCALLHEENQPEDIAINQRNVSYKDISNWWIRESRCTRLEEFRMVEEAAIFPFEI